MKIQIILFFICIGCSSVTNANIDPTWKGSEQVIETNWGEKTNKGVQWITIHDEENAFNVNECKMVLLENGNILVFWKDNKFTKIALMNIDGKILKKIKEISFDEEINKSEKEFGQSGFINFDPIYDNSGKKIGGGWLDYDNDAKEFYIRYIDSDLKAQKISFPRESISASK